MPEGREKFGEVLDRFLFAPIGAITSRSSDYEQAVVVGRKKVQEATEVATRLGQTAIESAVGFVSDFVKSKVEGRETNEEADPASESSPIATLSDDRDSERARESDEPFENYDTMSAPEINAQLGSLSPTQRAHVLAYEQSHRQRRTVLGRLAQLDGKN